MPHIDYVKRWQQPGDEKTTTVPSMVYPLSNERRDDFYAYSSANVLKGDNIRIGYIQLNYDLNKSLLQKLPVKNIQIYLNITNIGLLWRSNKEGLDPDYDTGNDAYLPPRRIATGVKIEF